MRTALLIWGPRRPPTKQTTPAFGRAIAQMVSDSKSSQRAIGYIPFPFVAPAAALGRNSGHRIRRSKGIRNTKSILRLDFR